MPEFVLNFARNLTSGVVGVLRGIITSGMGGNATGTGLPTFSNEIPITSNSAPSTGPSSTAQVANLVGILRMPWRLAAILQDIPHYDAHSLAAAGLEYISRRLHAVVYVFPDTIRTGIPEQGGSTPTSTPTASGGQRLRRSDWLMRAFRARYMGIVPIACIAAMLAVASGVLKVAQHYVQKKKSS